ncbi:MAG: hypothetical protein ABSG70_07600 [Terriglobales bacterium]
MKQSRGTGSVSGQRCLAAVHRIAILLLVIAGLGLLAQSAFAQTGYSGIFGGGPYYKDPSVSIPELEHSGFTEAIVWSVEVSSAGDLNFNGEFPLTSGGVYVGDQTYPNFASDLAQLKQGGVKRITFSIGSSNVGDWQDITALVQSQGTGPGSILYQDFQALKTAIPALDALDFDDENSYNLPTTVQFGVMLGGLGFHVLPDAYTNNTYWMSVVSEINDQLPGTVDGVHLQVYAGGGGNNPCSSEWNFGTVPVFPGLWDHGNSPHTVQTKMTAWHNECGISGGFMWLYDDFVGNGLAAKFANAIDDSFGIGGFTLAGPSSVTLKDGKTAKAAISVEDFGVFKGTVTLTVSPLPNGVTATVEPGNGKKQKVVFKAAAGAPTGSSPVTVTGTSGTITQTVTFTLVIDPA